MRLAAVIALTLVCAACSGGSSEADPEPTTVPPGPVATTTAASAPARRPLMGTAVRADALAADTAYAAFAGETFDVLTPENEMKWESTEPEPGTFDFTRGDAIAEFAAAHGQTVHGHTLAWYSQNPAWLTEGAFTRDELVAILERHVSALVEHFAGAVSVWDVVNEPIGDDAVLRPTIWSEAIGPEYIEIALRAARAADPDAALYLNEYGVETPGPKADAFDALVRDLVARDVPLDGVGLQMHVTDTFDGSGLDARLAVFADLGLDVAITEMDVRLELPADAAALDRQAAVYGRALDACVAAPNCMSFATWGWTDRYSWIPSFLPGWGAALPWDENLDPKPAATVLESALR